MGRTFALVISPARQVKVYHDNGVHCLLCDISITALAACVGGDCDSDSAHTVHVKLTFTYQSIIRVAEDL